MSPGLMSSLAEEEHSIVLETPQKAHRPVLLLGGLLPEFGMLFRNKAAAQQIKDEKEKQTQLSLPKAAQIKDENEKQTLCPLPKLQHVSRSLFDTSRLALSTIQTYKKELKNISPKFYPNEVEVKAKRVRKQSPPRSHKKTKYGKINSGVGHGIRRPKQKPNTSSTDNSDLRKSYLVKTLRQKVKKVASSTSTATKDPNTSVDLVESFSTDDSWSEDLRDELTEIVENLNSDIESEDVAKDVVISTDEQLNKIAELMRIMQPEEGTEEIINASQNLTLGEDKIQEVEDLLDMLLENEPNEQLNSPENSSFDQENSSESLCIALSKPTEHEIKNLIDIQELMEKLENSSYVDPNDTDPFSDESVYEEHSSCGEISSNLNSAGLCSSNSQSSNQATNSLIELSSENSSKIVISEKNVTQVSSDMTDEGIGKNGVIDEIIDSGAGESIADNDCLPLSTVLGEKLLCDQTRFDAELSNIAENHELLSDDLSSASNVPQLKIEKQKENKKQSSPTNKLFSIFVRSSDSGRDKSFENVNNLKTVFSNCSSPTLSARGSSPMSSPGSKASPHRAHKLPLQEKDGKEQMLLDAGQKKFGIETCDECGFLFDPDVRADAEAHLAHHNRHATLLRHKGWKNENIIADYEDGGRILLIKPGDPISWWRRVSTILEVVNHDLGFIEDIFNYSNIKYKVFLYIWKNYIAGCIVTEQISSANRMLPGTEALCSEETFPATCGITRIWTPSVFRRKGFASRLMKSVQENFLSHRDLEMEEIAFSSPTPDGRAFATKFFNTPTFLAY